VKIEELTLREIRLKLKAPFETSFGVTQERRILLVEALADGVHGWGEITAGEGPFYCPETTGTAWHVVNDFVAPMVVGKTVEAAADFPSLVKGIRGHEMAKAGVENALWDIEAQQKGLPLWKLLGGTMDEIPCGVSLGIQESVDVLLMKIDAEAEGRLPAHQDQDQARQGRKNGVCRAPAVQAHQADGGREFGLPAGGCAAAQAARRFLPDDD
jgi:O-succinylbenzoate synthase